MLPAILRAIGATAENHDHRILLLQLGKLAVFPGVIGKLVIREDSSRHNVRAHRVERSDPADAGQQRRKIPRPFTTPARPTARATREPQTGRRNIASRGTLSRPGTP